MGPKFSKGQKIVYPIVGEITFVKDDPSHHIFKTQSGAIFYLTKGELCPNCTYRHDCRYPADKANCIFKERSNEN